MPPTMIVGAHRTGSTDEMVRIGEYSPAIDAKRFAAHESFFVHDIRAWVQARFGVALAAHRTAVGGVSAGAEFSLAMGLSHPDIYGAVFAASPGAGYRPPLVMPTALPRTYFTAGTLEPFFLNNARGWAEALRASGGDVVITEPVGSHGGPFWQAKFIKMVAWAFED